jgi:hypothetical protein
MNQPQMSVHSEPKMSLSKIVKGRITQPVRLVLYGPPGIGKSTFAASAPAPIFIGAEKGTAQLDVERFAQPETWLDVLDAITELGTQQHGYQSLVIDTLDWIEPLIHAYVINEENKSSNNKVTNIDAVGQGYGRGYALALTQWRKLITYLERLSDLKKMNLLLLAHSQIKSFKNPEGSDFDRYELKLQSKAAGLVQEWIDEVLFCNYETCTTESKGRVRGISSGARVIHTTRTAAFDAKNRHDLPDELPLSWEDYYSAISAREPAAAVDIKKAIAELLENAGSDIANKVTERVEAAGNDAPKLTKILDRLRTVMKGQNK